MAATCKRQIMATRRPRHVPLTFSFLLLSILLAHFATAAPPSPPASDTDIQEHPQQTENPGIPMIHGIIPREQDQQAPGSECRGSEGQWNCMTTAWQRCAAGTWSVVMQCAAGTVCVPAGLTYDFKVQFAGEGQGQGSGGGRSSASKIRGPGWGLVLAVALFTVLIQLCS